MLRKTLIAAAVTAFALAASPVMAQGNGKAKGKAKKAKAAQYDRDHDRRHDHDRDYRYASHPGNNPKAQGRHDNGLHLGWYKQQWKRGDRLYWDHIERRYWLDDYGRYDLRRPPEGYRWVRPMDGRYLLVNIATGVILDALGY